MRRAGTDGDYDRGERLVNWEIQGGEVLTDGAVGAASVFVADGVVVATRPAAARPLDASGMLVLPGIVDVHGDGFERQIMPRPRVSFPLDLALHETDRQLVANGITTAFHGLTVSWEPGLRSLDNAVAFVAAWQRHRAGLACDTRLHLRWETFALAGADQVTVWLALEPTPILAFNDHTTSMVEKATIARGLSQMAERSGLDEAAYQALLAEVWGRRDEVPAAIDRLAAAARRAGAVMLAHDERSPEERARYRALGARASEFPMTLATARAARTADEHTILGAPNVVRGGSHCGALDAAAAAADGLCTVLTTDYFYPAPLRAAFMLAADGPMDLAAAWALVSRNAAAAAGLDDRGEIAPGRRADLIVVDARDRRAPRVVATLVGGLLVYAAVGARVG